MADSNPNDHLYPAHRSRLSPRRSLPRGVDRPCAEPGLTKTKFASALFSDGAAYVEWVKTLPLGHAEPEEMAGTVLYMTGECVVVDGGLTI